MKENQWDKTEYNISPHISAAFFPHIFHKIQQDWSNAGAIFSTSFPYLTDQKQTMGFFLITLVLTETYAIIM